MATVRRSTKKLSPTYRWEKALLAEGCIGVAGIDEVGRGPLAGPVLAGVAILPENPRGRWTRLVRDSKQLSATQRETALEHLQRAGAVLRVGACSSQEIDEIGILNATKLAMKRAVDSLILKPEHLLLDAIKLPSIDIPQTSIIKGDAKCLSIAAASIVAKVTRDDLMHQMDVLYPGYGFSKHKGYGTRAHMESLNRLGPCPIHRFSFAPVRAASIR